jgi:hypothetical protein
MSKLSNYSVNKSPQRRVGIKACLSKPHARLLKVFHLIDSLLMIIFINNICASDLLKYTKWVKRKRAVKVQKGMTGRI